MTDRRESKETREALAADSSIIGVLTDSERRLRQTSVAASERLAGVRGAVADLVKAAQPFVIHNSGDEQITITVSTESVRRLRAALQACGAPIDWPAFPSLKLSGPPVPGGLALKYPDGRVERITGIYVFPRRGETMADTLKRSLAPGHSIVYDPTAGGEATIHGQP